MTNSGYEMQLAEKDDRIAELKRKLANEQARDIHSCHPNCSRNGCVNRRLRAELEAAKAEIERLKTVPMKYRRMAFNAHLQDENAKLSKQLAAEQAKNVGLREKVQKFIDSLEECTDFEGFTAYIATMDDYHEAVEALSTQSDTSALEAIVKKAGEVMREECITAAGPEDSYQDDWIRAKIDACDAIRAIPAVTLEDLK